MRPNLVRLACSCLFVLVLGLLAPAQAWADTCTSTGSGTWGGTSDTATWSCGTPATGDDVVIAAGFTVTLAGSVTVQNLTVETGGSLTGAAGNDLTVTGDWSNSGTFTHGGSNVTLGAASGTQTVSGSTMFGKLYTAHSGTKDFGSSQITIETALYHNGGSMSAGTSTFTFGDSTTIGGGNLKRFYHLIINGASVTHSSGDMRISGNLTVQNGKTLTFSGSRIARFDGSALQTVTLNGSGIARFNTLIVDTGAVVRLPQTADTQFTAESLTNRGALQQSRSGVSGATEFLTVKNGAGSATVYQGLAVTPGAGSPDIAVSIAGNQSTCTNPNGGSYRDRCFRLHSSDVAANSNVILYSTAAEDDISNDAFYQYSGGTWTKKADCGAADGVQCSATVDLAAGDNYFLIGDRNSGPTPVVLTAFDAARTPEGVAVSWQTGVEIDFAGFYVWRGAQEAGPFRRVSPFIAAAGSPVNGASYRYDDLVPSTGQAHFYRLEAVDVDNSTEFFQPTVRAAASEPARPDHRLFLPITSRR